MASSASSLLKLEIQATGENDGTWGDIFQNNLNRLEETVAGEAAFTVTAADVTLTDTQYDANQSRRAVLAVTGTLTGNRSIIVPARTKLYVVKNGTAGAFTLTIKVTGQTGVTVPQGTQALCYCNGTDVELISLHGNAPDGTVALPAYSFNSDLDTGMYRIDANTLGFAVNGAEAARIDSTGLGIGLAAVGRGELVIAAAGSAYLAIFDTDQGSTGGTDGASIGMTGVNMDIINRENGSMVFYTNNTERFRISSAGAVSITTPTAGQASATITNATDGTNSSTGWSATTSDGTAFYGAGAPSYTAVTGAADTALINTASLSGGFMIALSNTPRFKISAAGVVDLSLCTGILTAVGSLPTSNPGAGLLWNNSGVVNVGT